MEGNWLLQIFCYLKTGLFIPPKQPQHHLFSAAFPDCPRHNLSIL